MLELGVSHLFGCSTQSTEYQQELRQRTHLPYRLLSDENLELVKGAKLPVFEYNVCSSSSLPFVCVRGSDGCCDVSNEGQGTTLIKRLALAIEDGQIVKVWYPVFPSDKNASDVLEWLKTRT